MSINQYNSQKPAFGRAHLAGAPAQQGFGRQAYSAPAYSTPAYSGGGGNYTANNNSLTPGRTVVGLRYVSGIVDTIVVTILIFAVFFLFIFIETGVFNDTKDFTGIAVLASCAAAFLYGVILDASKWQGTIGKIATNTIVTDYEGKRISLGRSLWRNIGKILSTFVPFYIPYFMVNWTAENQTLHDMMSRVLVRKNLGDTPTDGTYDKIFA